jgi:hypothetical protein
VWVRVSLTDAPGGAGSFFVGLGSARPPDRPPLSDEDRAEPALCGVDVTLDRADDARTALCGVDETCCGAFDDAADDVEVGGAGKSRVGAELLEGAAAVTSTCGCVLEGGAGAGAAPSTAGSVLGVGLVRFDVVAVGACAVDLACADGAGPAVVAAGAPADGRGCAAARGTAAPAGVVAAGGAAVPVVDGAVRSAAGAGRDVDVVDVDDAAAAGVAALGRLFDWAAAAAVAAPGPLDAAAVTAPEGANATLIEPRAAGEPATGALSLRGRAAIDAAVFLPIDLIGLRPPPVR